MECLGAPQEQGRLEWWDAPREAGQVMADGSGLAGRVRWPSKEQTSTGPPDASSRPIIMACG